MEETCVLSQRLVERKNDSLIAGKVSFTVLFDRFASNGQSIGVGELFVLDELGDDSCCLSAMICIHCDLSTYKGDHQLCDTPP